MLETKNIPVIRTKGGIEADFDALLRIGPDSETKFIDINTKGNLGAKVALQYLLKKEVGLEDIDGSFGVDSDLALRRFQTSKGLNPDGDAGADTIGALVALHPEYFNRSNIRQEVSLKENSVQDLKTPANHYMGNPNGIKVDAMMLSLIGQRGRKSFMIPEQGGGLSDKISINSKKNLPKSLSDNDRSWEITKIKYFTRAIQANLTLAGYPTVPDGGFGPNTETSVKKFQSENNIFPDGVANRETIAALLRHPNIARKVAKDVDLVPTVTNEVQERALGLNTNQLMNLIVNDYGLSAETYTGKVQMVQAILGEDPDGIVGTNTLGRISAYFSTSPDTMINLSSDPYDRGLLGLNKNGYFTTLNPKEQELVSKLSSGKGIKGEDIPDPMKVSRWQKFPSTSLILGMSYQESTGGDFKRLAEGSKHGEIGAFQVTQETIDMYWTKKRLNMGRPFDHNNPEDHFLVAKAYTTHQLKLREGNVKMALWGYNGGPGHVSTAIRNLQAKNLPLTTKNMRQQFITDGGKSAENLIVTFRHTNSIIGKI